MAIDDIVCTHDSVLQKQSSNPFFTGHKVINDPIHGHIKLDNYTVDMIDTVQFQRLRDLKQLGSAYFVFPGASHNRFEHSIGVSHLAGTLIERFQQDQPELNITEDEVKCVKLAGHIFDNEFMPRARPGFQWSHEEASEMMLEYMIDDNHIDLERENINLIKDLIAGAPRSSSQFTERGFLFDIVANKKNSVDVDKFDYIERDAQNLGLRSSYDAKRLLVYSRVVDNEICFHHKEVYNLYEMFHTRYSLFKRIYTHRVGKAIELMITDALLSADPYLDISQAVQNPEDYMNLTDSILGIIERSKTTELAEARAIIKRLRTRNLYKFVDEFLVPPELVSHLNKDMVSAKEIVSYQKNGDNLEENDVIVSWTKINYAMKDRNPVDSIRFFSKFDDNTSFTIPKQQVSYMIPSQFEEVVIRVFTRTPEKITAIQRAFRQLMKGIAPVESNHALEPNAALTVPSDYERIRLGKRQRSFSNGNDNDIVKKWEDA
ncbi:HD phosphohydrolase domain-containing protein [Radiomyces spectabilis]|uniref:HD phosphohydrolase domain-containing protein n=1 Tax=Radiomyces spectabilis TaxID=64574 RepID=UPI00221FDAE6|nr:HD phosphohydrolase domain-containing protein [Radiomyces spectabilis]KAI8393865.1 HD phosphohydrolase domain-containing protein [Radiomyces spectabilis]